MKKLTPVEARALLLAACDSADEAFPGAAPDGVREAIEALPDMMLLDALEPPEMREALRARYYRLIGAKIAQA